MELRKIFDTIPERFDRWRPRYSQELFDHLIREVGIGADSEVLELGPGTGQATDPVLATGCDYLAIELGPHLAAKMQEKYGARPNFHIINDDFITHDFGDQKFDVIYSAATIQWIPEEVAYSKTFELLKPGGMLAMMLTSGEYRSSNEALYQKIQQVYDQYYKPEIPYRQRFDYTNGPAYGYVDLEKHEFYGERRLTADEYVAYCGTHSDHLTIAEPGRTAFFEGLLRTVRENGDLVVFKDTYVLYTLRKPE